MGNNCCKERINRASDSKNPVDRLIGRCAKICPSMLPQDNNWGKHVLETRAPNQTQPQKSNTLDGWRTATLSVPDNSIANKTQIIIKEELPVAPPRKKRRAASFAALPTKSQLNDRKSSMIPNGFRDVFGREERRYSTESILNERAAKCKSLDSRLANMENITKLRRHSSYSSSLDEFADFSKDSPANRNDTLTRVVPKIGNKKTDKFFGESLAACLTDEERRKSSIAETDFFHLQKRKENQEVVPKENVILNSSPVRPPPPNPPKRRNSIQKDGELAVKIEKSTVNETASAETKPEEKSSSLDRKAKFLMDMLEPTSPLEEQYKGRIPVEEPLMVAKKKQIKCVCCDDDDQLKHHLHLHEKKLEEIDLSNPPRKPSRDFSKISTKSIEKDIQKTEVPIPELPQRTHRVKRSLTHDDTEENLKKISEQSVKLHRNISMPTVESLLQSEEELENLMKRCNSSNSFEAHDIIDELIQKAYPGFDGISSILHDQRHDSYDDGSHLVAPSFKLGSKKNSFTRLNSMSSVTSGVSSTVETDQDGADKKTVFSIGPKEIELSDFNKNVEDFIQIETKSAVISKPQITVQTPEVTEMPQITVQTPEVTEKSEGTKEIETKSNRPKVNKDLILDDENPQQSHLDDSAINQIIESSDLNVNNLTSVLDDIYANNKNIVDDFHNYLEVEANKDLVALHKVPSRSKLSESETEKPSDLIKSDPKLDYEADEEQDIEEELPHIKPIAILKYDRPRRDSIDDVDIWFSRHNTAPINKNLNEIVNGPNKERRSSEGNYDTSKMYPFGQISRERTTSQSSADFFENRHQSIPHLNLVGTDEYVTVVQNEKVRKENATDSKDDHSKLLAILKKESPNKKEM